MVLEPKEHKMHALLELKRTILALYGALQRVLKKAGYQKSIPYTSPFISQANAAKRFRFAQEHRRKIKAFWRRGIFINESSFNIRMLHR